MAYGYYSDYYGENTTDSTDMGRRLKQVLGDRLPEKMKKQGLKGTITLKKAAL